MFKLRNKVIQKLKFIHLKMQEKPALNCLRIVLLALLDKTTKAIYLVIGSIFFPICFVRNIKFLNVMTSRIGHLCVEPDCYIKEGLLGKHPSHRAIILAERGNVANEHMLAYWSRYFRVIRSPVLCLLLKPLSRNCLTGFNVYRYASVLNKAADFPWIQAEYHESGGRPLLSLLQSDYTRGWDVLERLGMPRDAWYVCVHCREDGYISSEGQTYRNADIANYLPAMEAIIERGGWVVRVGDSSMSPISPQKNTIDYANLDVKSDWMDVFLCATCRCFLGSDSGLFALANIFGVPAGTVNNAPMAMTLTFGPHNVGIPMFIQPDGEESVLTFKEVLSSPIGSFRFDYLYSKAGVRTVQNSCDDIKSVAMEMLDRSEGKAVYTAEDECLQMRFKALMNHSHYTYKSISRVGRDFLRKHSHLLEDKGFNTL